MLDVDEEERRAMDRGGGGTLAAIVVGAWVSMLLAIAVAALLQHCTT